MHSVRTNIQDFFSGLSFEEKRHKYSIPEGELKISVSGLISKYKYPTDWNRVKIQYAEKHNMTVDEVSALWRIAADEGKSKGNKAHIFGENYALDRRLKPKTGYDKAIVKFWGDLPNFIQPLILECQMYHKKYLFAGTADILFYNLQNNTIIIGDYKTNKELFNNFLGQKMQYPFANLLCQSFNHYQLQLSYYQILLEQIPGIKVSGRKLIWIKEDGTYLLYNANDYSAILKNELELHGI